MSLLRSSAPQNCHSVKKTKQNKTCHIYFIQIYMYISICADKLMLIQYGPGCLMENVASPHFVLDSVSPCELHERNGWWMNDMNIWSAHQTTIFDSPGFHHHPACWHNSKSVWRANKTRDQIVAADMKTYLSEISCFSQSDRWWSWQGRRPDHPRSNSSSLLVWQKRLKKKSESQTFSSTDRRSKIQVDQTEFMKNVIS